MTYRGFIYGYNQVFNYNSSTFQRLLKERNGWGYENNFREARDLDWVFVRNWNNGQVIYNPPLGENCHEVKEFNDTGVGLTGEIPCFVYHLGEPGLNHETRVTEKFQ